MSPKSLHYFLTLAFTFTMVAQAIAQNDSKSPALLDTNQIGISTDTVLPKQIQKTADIINEKLREKYKSQLAISRQERVFASLRAVFQRTHEYLKSGMDTVSLNRELTIAEQHTDFAGEGIFANVGSVQTSRNLATTSVMLTEIGSITNQQERKIDKYLTDLEEFRTTIDSLASDSFFLYIPTDSVELRQQISQLRQVGVEIRETDSSLNANLRSMRKLKTRATIVSGDISSKMDEIETYRAQLSQNSLSQETAYIWQKPKFSRPFSEIIGFSLKKNNMVLTSYLKNHIGKILLVLLITMGMTLYLRSMRQNILHEMGPDSSLAHTLVLEHPILCSLVICISICQFIFPNPPFSFYAITWTLNGILLIIVLWNHITAFWLRFWIASVTLAVGACGINMILQASRPERVIMLVLSFLGALAGLKVLFSNQKNELKEKKLPIFLWISVAMELGSIVANIYGRYNLAKGLMTTGFFSFVVGVQLLWTIKLLHEIFDISAEAYREDEKRRFYIDFEKVGSEVPAYLYPILGLGWLILIAHNFYIYTKITEPVVTFFTESREIGSYTFSFSGILLFIAIIILSGVVSKLVSYFADNGKSRSGSKKSGLGNWLLLIRIAIFSIGLFLAFAASGIPMDRVAIVFGALSVGIGFGLQTLVNNLVSGIIIAFEKPISVGDVVEIGGRSGTMKSIGFRSSVVTTFDGSEVIIPNGDLLNQHLINWTLNDNPRRVEVLVGVNYGTKIDDAVQLIHDILKADDRVRKFPESFVLVNNFGNSSIDLRILFWVSHFTNWTLVKSDVMRSIKNKFDEQGIEIPYPQMVLHQSAPASNDQPVDNPVNEDPQNSSPRQ